MNQKLFAKRVCLVLQLYSDCTIQKRKFDLILIIRYPSFSNCFTWAICLDIISIMFFARSTTKNGVDLSCNAIFKLYHDIRYPKHSKMTLSYFFVFCDPFTTLRFGSSDKKISLFCLFNPLTECRSCRSFHF